MNPLKWFGRGKAAPPRVSIVMPTLNQAGFIAESVASVMTQQVPGGLELFIADGGSSDGTLEQLAGLAAQHPGRVRWASAPDGGPAQAVNAAVAMARGAVIGWLNSDDLYTPGAVQRALDHLDREPGHVMVYGEAEHVDAQGRRLAAYPTRPPTTPLADWADGCHVCQPSAFFRRDVFQALGGLDVSLRASFDYDFWLRLFKAYPGGVGHLQAVQAQSRLHAATITTRFRERVALEGLQVVHRHLGAAPAHWLLTHFGERQAGHPFDEPSDDLVADLRALLQRAAPWLTADAAAHLEAYLAGHRALQLARPGFFAPVHADGWAPPVLDVRLRQPQSPIGSLTLFCRHDSPVGGSLLLEVATPADGSMPVEVRRRGPFVIELPVRDLRPGARLIYRVQCPRPFVPADCDPGSTDPRSLAFLVEDVQMQAGS